MLRIVAAFAVQSYVSDAGRPFLIEGDANGYWELGQKIAAGDEYSIYTPPRRVLRVPGFPLLLSASILVFGNDILAARLVLAVIGGACCWLTFLLGRQLFNPKVGFWAAAYVSLNPIHIGNSVLILSETWFAFWMLLSLLALEQLHRKLNTASHKRTPHSSIIASAATTGILIGLTVLVRPGFLPWLGCVAVAVVFVTRFTLSGQNALEANTDLEERRPSRGTGRGVRFLSAAAVVAACAIIMSPWTVRNFQVTGHVVLTSLWSGPSLYDGLSPTADGASDMRFFDRENVLAEMSEFEMNQHYKQKALDFAVSNPGRALGLMIPKAGQYLSPVPNSLKERGWAIYGICITTWALLPLGLIIGLCSRGWAWFDLLITLGPFLLFLGVHMVFVGSVRYRLPVEFPLSVLAAMGWHWAVLKLRKLT